MEQLISCIDLIWLLQLLIKLHSVPAYHTIIPLKYTCLCIHKPDCFLTQMCTCTHTHIAQKIQELNAYCSYVYTCLIYQTECRQIFHTERPRICLKNDMVYLLKSHNLSLHMHAAMHMYSLAIASLMPGQTHIHACTNKTNVMPTQASWDTYTCTIVLASTCFSTAQAGQGAIHN